MLPEYVNLVEPFEWILTEGPRKGHVTRPVLYTFEHVVLPDCLFTWHPELSAVLRGKPTLPPPLSHMWSKTMVHCTERKATQPGSPKGMEGCWEYILPMAKSVQITTADTDTYFVWILSMPSPRSPPDCHFVALCKPKDESDEYLLMNRSTRSRYFTLETSGEPGSGYFCAWDAEGSHANFGYEEDTSLERFKSRVAGRLPH